jgi:hypothetical protein
VAPDADALRRTAWVMRIGPRPDAMKPDIHGVRTQWIRGLMAFQLVRHAQVIRLAESDIVIFMGQCGG